MRIDGDYNRTNPVAYAFNVFPTPISAPIKITGLGFTPSPDLKVDSITVVGTPQVVSGGNVTVTWNDTNAGTRPTAGSWLDRVTVRAEDGSIIANVTLAYDEQAAGNGPIDPGQFRQRQITISLPQGAAGAGNLTFSISTDIENSVSEETADGQAEINNTTSLVVNSLLAIYPDLQIQNVSVDPASGFTAGDQVTINWTVANTGNKEVTGDWTETVQIRNLTTGQTISLANLRQSAAENGDTSFGPGETRSRHTVITWPPGVIGTGNIEFAVTADVLGEISEANGDGAGESNNRTAISVSSAPDLIVDNFTATASVIQSGSTLTIQWTDRNIGNAATAGGFSDRVVIHNFSTGEELLNVLIPMIRVRSVTVRSRPDRAGPTR